MSSMFNNHWMVITLIGELHGSGDKLETAFYQSLLVAWSGQCPSWTGLVYHRHNRPRTLFTYHLIGVEDETLDIGSVVPKITVNC